MIYQGNKTYQVDMAQNYAVSGGSGVTSIVRTEITVAGRAATIHEAATGDMYIYHISDHLGNTRVSFSVNTNHTISVESYTDYYASGWEMPGRTHTSANRTRFGYQGAFTENDADLGMTTFDLRAYDARLMRWHNPDPYQEFHSPYCAMGNDWVNLVDPSGGSTGGPSGGGDPIKEFIFKISEFALGGQDRNILNNKVISSLPKIVSETKEKGHFLEYILQINIYGSLDFAKAQDEPFNTRLILREEFRIAKNHVNKHIKDGHVKKILLDLFNKVDIKIGLCCQRI